VIKEDFNAILVAEEILETVKVLVLFLVIVFIT